MKKINAFFSILLFVVTIHACVEKEDITGPLIFNEASSIVRVYTEEEAQYLSEEPSENLLLFDSDTPDEILPEIGTIIQMPITENTPYGFLGKVTSIEYGDKIAVITEEVALDEAYPALSIDTTIDILGDIIGVYDEDGNPVEYTIEDNSTPATREIGEFDWENKVLNIPVPADFLGDDISVSGSIKVSFIGSKYDLDNVDEFKYFNLELNPSIGLSASIKTKIKTYEKTYSTKKYKVKARAVVGPVVIPITIPICFKAGVSGEITSTMQLNYTGGCKAYIRYKDGDWDKGCYPIKNGNETPWGIVNFEADGSIYAGINVEVIAGIYTTTSGLGIELFPHAYLSCNALLSSINPFDINPEIGLGAKLSSRVFCMGKIFNKKLSLFNIKLPDVTFFERKLSLFPNVSEFSAQGGNLSAEISYQHDSYYLLQGFGVKTGATIFEADKTTEYNTYYPSHTSIDKDGIRYYNVNVNGLHSGETYYAAPIISWFDYKWYGEKKEITTEGNYILAFRCSSQSYDVINFNFPLNNTSGNVLDFTTEATDYNGAPMRVHITAQYNAENKTLNGIFDFYFYNDPSQQRKDGFTISLANDDSGYVTCNKIINNGGCYASIRVYSANSNSAKSQIYSTPLTDDDCNVGFYNKNYKK